MQKRKIFSLRKLAIGLLAMSVIKAQATETTQYEAGLTASFYEHGSTSSLGGAPNEVRGITQIDQVSTWYCCASIGIRPTAIFR